MNLRSILRRLRRPERRWIPMSEERDEHESTVRSRLDPGRRPAPPVDEAPPPEESPPADT